MITIESVIYINLKLDNFYAAELIIVEVKLIS